jgi:hypothetical protein
MCLPFDSLTNIVFLHKFTNISFQVRPKIPFNENINNLFSPLNDQQSLLHANPESFSLLMKYEECKVNYLSLRTHHKCESHNCVGFVCNTSPIAHQNPHHNHTNLLNNQT